MATVNEQIVTGRKFRKLIDETNKLWQRISIWTKASDVEFDDGTTAETKVGAINGVTDSLTSTSSNIAASAAAVKALNDKVTELSSNLRPPIIFNVGTVVIGIDHDILRLKLVSFICQGNVTITPIGNSFSTSFARLEIIVNGEKIYTATNNSPVTYIFSQTTNVEIVVDCTGTGLYGGDVGVKVAIE